MNRKTLRGRIVHIGNTSEGYGIYVDQKSYAVAKGMRPFILCADKYGGQFRVYLNKDDRETVLSDMHSGEKFNLHGQYRKLRLASYIYTEQGWVKRNE